MRLVFLLVALVSCAVAVEDVCGPDEDGCCVEDQECIERYGVAYPYCYGAERGTGICSECSVDQTCQTEGEVCHHPDAGPAFCEPSLTS
jgi:hypothetical protein